MNVWGFVQQKNIEVTSASLLGFESTGCTRYLNVTIVDLERSNSSPPTLPKQVRESISLAGSIDSWYAIHDVIVET